MNMNAPHRANEFAAAWHPRSQPNAIQAAAFDNLLVAIHTVTRRRLDAIVPLVFQANAQGQIDDDSAVTLHEAAEMRRKVFAARSRVANHKPPRPEKPRHPRSRWKENRRVWSGSGPLPPSLRALFTAGENAVAAIIRAEVRKHGVCKLPYSAIAKSAGLLSTTVVKRFVRIAKARGLIHVQERKVSGNRNAPNIITITSGEWKKWNEVADRGERKGGGGISVSPIQNQDIYRPMENPQHHATARLGATFDRSQGLMRGAGGGDSAQPFRPRQGFGPTAPNPTRYGPTGGAKNLPKA